MSSDNRWIIALGIVGAILLLAARGDESEEPVPSSDKTPEQREAERIQKLMKGGHYKDAVSSACNLLFGLIRRKSGVDDKDAMSLIDHVFTPKKPILKFTRYADYPHLKQTHEGYYYLLKGVVIAFRNPVSHANVKMTKDEAAQQLSLIAFLYGMIEQFSVRN